MALPQNFDLLKGEEKLPFFVSRKRRMETDWNRTVYGILPENPENVTCGEAQRSQYAQDSRLSLSICSKTGMLKILKSSWSTATVMLGT